MTKELTELANKYPVCVPVSAAAKFLHIGDDALRASIEQNRCPFGFSWKMGVRTRYKIPTITFVAWLTKGTLDLLS